MLTSGVRRVNIAHVPTPLQEMKRLSQQMGGPRLFIKRDDQTGLATGGNKARKLEYLIADALAQGADTVLTVGGAQSNWVRQTAAAAAMFGLRCVLVLRGTSPAHWNGNLLLDDLLGAEVRWAGEIPLDEVHQVMTKVALQEEAAGRRPCVIPLGGSTPVGAAGYVAAMEELVGQLTDLHLSASAIVFASGSGGTQAGLIVGAKALGFEGKIVGISVLWTEKVLMEALNELVPQTARHLGLQLSFDQADFRVYGDYLGGGYGVLGDLEREAIRLIARTEGILLDPVYTGRAMGGLLDLIRKGVFAPADTVIFWHTGGTPALFAYSQELMTGVPRRPYPLTARFKEVGITADNRRP
jgi:D-cysteine desulfhydrase